MQVSFETAKRLAEAGFPHPKPESNNERFWYQLDGSLIFLGHTVDDHCEPIEGGSYFAQTATDILRELPEYAIALHIEYRAEGGEAWFCWDTLDRAKTFSHPTSPAEAAAMAWLSQNAKP